MASQASDKRSLIRKDVWNSMYDQEILVSSTLPYKMVPIFKDIDAAVDRLLELDVIKSSEKVLLSMEKSMKDVRLRLLQEKQKIYVTTYKSTLSTVCRVDAPEKSKSKFVFKQAANLLLKDRNHSIKLGEEKFDVLVVSSIAVSSDGRRISKADVLGELEFPILYSLGYVTEDTVVVTLVHDLQVVQNIPQEDLHKLPVDYIITPSRVINCPKSKKDISINWSALKEADQEKLDLLKSLRYKEWKEGKDVHFNGEENPTNLEEPEPKELSKGRGSGRKISFNDRRSEQRGDGRRRRISGKEGGDGRGQLSFGRRPRKFYGRRRRFNPSDDTNFKPAVYIGDLPKDLTPGNLTELLSTKGVFPSSIVKRDDLEHAFAIFEKDVDINQCISNLQGLSVGEKPVKIEISRQTARRIRPSNGGQDN